MSDLSRTVAIVGAAESDELGIVPHKSALQHHAEAAHNALADAGLSARDVDGLFTAGFSTLATGEYMGIRPRYTDSTSVGGSSFVLHVGHAAAAINAGYCDVALITHGQTGRSARGRGSNGGGLSGPESPMAEFEAPYGIIGPPVGYAMACSRYMHQYGEARTHQAMADIAVSTRQWAQLNPKALMQDPLSFADYYNSRWIAWPFHLLDCCLVTDAGAAVVLTRAERARDLAKKPVWVLGAAEHHDHYLISQMPDLTVTPASVSGPAALARAGVRLQDLDLTMLYDSFTYTVLITLESLGYCGPGEGPDFVSDQRTAPGGDFPLNTSGGGLSYTHPGMYGIFLIVEAVRQLRGECGARQVPDCRLALVNGTGGFLSSTGTAVLAAD